VPGTPRSQFQYAVLRVVPRIERGECFNAGVVLFCRPRRYLSARAELDPRRLDALAPGADAEVLRAHLDALVAVADGDLAAGPIAALDQSDRFHWLVAPSSTVLQPSPVHTGLCEDPAEMLDRLFRALVLPVEDRDDS
jgi:hypothetical protein